MLKKQRYELLDKEFKITILKVVQEMKKEQNQHFDKEKKYIKNKQKIWSEEYNN